MFVCCCYLVGVVLLDWFGRVQLLFMIICILLRVIDIITLVLLVLDCGFDAYCELDWFVVIVYLLFS